MNDHLSALAERRTRLQEKAAAQRRQLQAQIGAIEARFSSFDRGFMKVRSWVGRPLLLAGGAALLLGVGSGRALQLAGKAALLIATTRRLLRLAR